MSTMPKMGGRVLGGNSKVAGKTCLKILKTKLGLSLRLGESRTTARGKVGIVGSESRIELIKKACWEAAAKLERNLDRKKKRRHYKNRKKKHLVGNNKFCNCAKRLAPDGCHQVVKQWPRVSGKVGSLIQCGWLTPRQLKEGKEWKATTICQSQGVF